MAPEQMQGAANLDRRADVYGVGVMMWEALTGKRLWHGTADVDVFTAVLNEGVPRPRTVNPDVNEKLEAICMKALERDAEKRYETCAHMQTDLEQAVEELGLRASSKETGRIVQELFAEMRMSIRRAIERKLKAMVSQPPPPLNAVTDGDAFLQGESLLSTGGATTTQGTGTGSGTKSRLAWVAILVAAVLLAAGGTALALRARTSAAVSATPDARMPTAQVTPPPRQGETIEMHLSASPDESTLYFDGKMLPANPFVGLLPVDNLPHEFRAEAGGYVTKSVALSLMNPANASVQITLDAVKSAPRPTKAAANLRWTGPRVAATASVAPAPAPPNCDRPFSIDSAGIRHVRQECL
jgi:hypothetical protein